MGYRILSLDGGGSWALIEAIALREIYGDVPGREILSHFDLAVANSGGSIILGGLAINKRPSEIISLLMDEDNRRSIFSGVSSFRRFLSRMPIFPRYSADGKLAGLRKLFGLDGDQPLSSFAGSDWVRGPLGEDVKLLIVAFDYDSRRARFFRSFVTGHGATPDPTPLVCAIHASTNAPIKFFDGPTHFDDRRFWDGAMGGNNNPLMAAVTDCLTYGVKAQDISALTIGTGTAKLVACDAKPRAPDHLREARQSPGILSDLGIAAGCINDDPPDNATFTAHTIIASARNDDPTELSNVVRLSPVVRPILVDGLWIAPPGMAEADFLALQTLEMDAVRQADIDSLRRMTDAWIAGDIPNQAIRMTWDFQNELGDPAFTQAVDRWLTICRSSERAPEPVM